MNETEQKAKRVKEHLLNIIKNRMFASNLDYYKDIQNKSTDGNLIKIK